MLDKVHRTIAQYALISRGELILVGVSGGPDSIALLHCLFRLSDNLGFHLHVVHVNHGLRAEADEEALFVRQFAGSLGIPATVRNLDPAELKRGSLEELARKKRREVFLQESNRTSAAKVALGHNANDQAETVLQRLLRGGGTGGLGGIHPIRDNFIRPLLFVSRKEIEDYVQRENLEFRVDKSNLQPVYLRNKIRLKLIPTLQAEYNPRLVEALGKTALLLQEDNHYLEQEALAKCTELMVKLGGNYFLPHGFSDLPRPVATRMVRRVYSLLTGDPRGLEYDHVTKVLSLATAGRSGGTIELPAGAKVLKEIDGLVFYSGCLNWPDIKEQVITIPGEIEAAGTKLLARVTDKTALDPKDMWSIAIAYESVSGPVWIRKRKPGDKILVGHSYKKLKEVYNDLRVPSRVRDTRPVVLINEEIAWIPGITKSSMFNGLCTSGKVLELIVSNN